MTMFPVLEGRNPEEQGSALIWRNMVLSQLMSPCCCGVAHRAHSCMCHEFCKMAPPTVILFSAVGCSVPVAFLWGPKILFTKSLAINSLQPPISWDPWPFLVIAPSCNHAVVASACRGDLRCVQSCVCRVTLCQKNREFRQIWKLLMLWSYWRLKMGKHTFLLEGNTSYREGYLVIWRSIPSLFSICWTISGNWVVFPFFFFSFFSFGAHYWYLAPAR